MRQWTGSRGRLPATPAGSTTESRPDRRTRCPASGGPPQFLRWRGRTSPTSLLAMRCARRERAVRRGRPANDALREHVQNRRVRWPEPGSADKLRAGSRAHHLLLGDGAPVGRQRDNSPAPSLHLSEPRRHGQRTRMRRPDEHLRRRVARQRRRTLVDPPPGRFGWSKPRDEVQTPTSCLSSALPFTCQAGAAKVLSFGVSERMDEAGDGQQRQQCGDDVGHRGDLLALHAEDAEPERGEQQPAEGLALEEAVTLRRDGGQLLLQVRQGRGRWPPGPRRPRLAGRSAGRRGRRRSGRRRSTGGAGR